MWHLKNLFIFVCVVHRVFIAVHRLSLFAQVSSEGYSLVAVCSLLLQWLILLWSWGSRTQRLWWLQLLGARMGAQSLWCRDLFAQWHVESSWIRNQIRVPTLARGFLTTGQLEKPMSGNKEAGGEGNCCFITGLLGQFSLIQWCLSRLERSKRRVLRIFGQEWPQIEGTESIMALR